MNRFQVFFDGGCLVCSSEIEFYRRKKGAELIEWIDIQSGAFDADAEGVDRNEINRVFHVKDEQGRWITGVDAFIEIWNRIPSLNLLAISAKLPGSRMLMKIGYSVFVKIRPYLPRKASACASGYCEGRR